MKTSQRNKKGFETLPSLFRMAALVSVLLYGGCRSGGKTGQAAEGNPFAFPQIPALMTAPGERAAYAVAHFWDHYDFADTALLRDPRLEQFFADYVYNLGPAPAEAARKSLGGLVAKAGSDSLAFGWFTEMLEKYLYDPNSPLRNEALYEMALDGVLASPRLDSLTRIRPLYQKAQIQKNRPGTVAADFGYTLANGRQGRLHGVRGEYVLLYFYNPDCPDCRRVRQFIEQSPVISSLSAADRLTVLAVYPDEDLTAWRGHLAEMPAAWINGHAASPEVRNALYDLRAIPSLYLLDREKTVLLKDATPEQVEAHLQRLNQ